MKQLYTALFVAITTGGFAQTTQSIGTTTVTIDTLISSMNVPWEMRLEGDSYLWVTERIGLVNRIDLETGEKTVMLDLTGTVHAEGESGLLGMALHPAFAQVPEVFLVYTYGTADTNGYFKERLERYEFDGTQLGTPLVLIDNITSWTSHDGSRLFFLPDQTLLMSTGEHNQQDLAQDSTSLSGKFLRVNMDGTIPHDNPDSTSYIYTMGHRNPQGICMLPDSTIIVSEHGPFTDDELQVLEAGKNYGWPLIEGFCDESFEAAPCATGLYTEPIYHWTPTIAPSDLVYYQNPYFPEWDERLLMTTLNGQRLVAMKLSAAEDTIIDEDQYFQGQFGRLRDIAVTSDKKIFIATNTGTPGAQAILRITPPYFASVDEQADPPVFTVNPNPARDQITISRPLNNATVRVLDLNGREMLVMEHVQTGDKISMLNLQPGFYMVEVSEKGSFLGKDRILKL